MTACQWSIGSWLATTVERLPWQPSRISSRSRRRASSRTVPLLSLSSIVTPRDLLCFRWPTRPPLFWYWRRVRQSHGPRLRFNLAGNPRIDVRLPKTQSISDFQAKRQTTPIAMAVINGLLFQRQFLREVARRKKLGHGFHWLNAVTTTA